MLHEAVLAHDALVTGRFFETIGYASRILPALDRFALVPSSCITPWARAFAGKMRLA
jgi:hypothetical protein